MHFIPPCVGCTTGFLPESAFSSRVYFPDDFSAGFVRARLEFSGYPGFYFAGIHSSVVLAAGLVPPCLILAICINCFISWGPQNFLTSIVARHFVRSAATYTIKMDAERSSLDKQQDFIETEEAGPSKLPGIDETSIPPALAALSEEEYERVKKSAVRKLDLRIMPAVVLMYILNYLDRQNIASAKLAGLVQDLNMTSVQYQTAVSLLFAGYSMLPQLLSSHSLIFVVTMQIPSNMIASKIKWPGIYINVAMAVWGAISACTAAVNNFSGLVAARFFLGVVEAAFLPGVVYYISLFYNRQQMTLRTAIFYSGSQIGNAVGPLIAIGVLNLEGKQGISGWRWLFIIEGVVTIFFAIIFAVILPHSLQTIRGFTELENQFLQYNYAKDIGQQDHKDEASAWKGLKLAVSDPKTWLLLATLWAVRIQFHFCNNFY